MNRPASVLLMFATGALFTASIVAPAAESDSSPAIWQPNIGDWTEYEDGRRLELVGIEEGLDNHGNSRPALIVADTGAFGDRPGSHQLDPHDLSRISLSVDCSKPCTDSVIWAIVDNTDFGAPLWGRDLSMACEACFDGSTYSVESNGHWLDVDPSRTFPLSIDDVAAVATHRASYQPFKRGPAHPPSPAIIEPAQTVRGLPQDGASAPEGLSLASTAGSGTPTHPAGSIVISAVFVYQESWISVAGQRLSEGADMTWDITADGASTTTTTHFSRSAASLVGINYDDKEWSATKSTLPSNFTPEAGCQWATPLWDAATTLGALFQMSKIAVIEYHAEECATATLDIAGYNETTETRVVLDPTTGLLGSWIRYSE